MTATVETFENRSTVVTEIVLEVIRVEKGLSVFRQIKTETVEKNDGTMLAPSDPKISEAEGLIDDKNLSFLKKGREFKPVTKFVVMSQAMRDKFASTTYSNAWDSDLFKTDVVRGKGLFDHFLNGGTPDDLVIMDTSSHYLKDRHGAHLPVGMQFDYISNGRITNRNYDLEKAAEILLARSDVDVWAHQGGWNTEKPAVIRDGRHRENKMATTIEEALFRIPYYNSDGGRMHTLYFVWKPTVEQYRALHDAASNAGRNYSSMDLYKAAFDLDVLGLRAGGAAKYEDYYKDDPAVYHDGDED